MKKFFLIPFAVVFSLIVIFLAVAAFQPEEYRVERSITTTAPQALVFSMLNDLHAFPEWSPWQKLDPNVKTSFDGPQTGIGSSYAWEGNDKVGSGKMTITQVVPNENVGIHLEFFKPWAGVSQTNWAVQPDSSGATRIIWTMSGKNEGIAAKAMGLLMSMDAMIGKDFEEGLNNLKALAEKTQADTPQPETLPEPGESLPGKGEGIPATPG